MKIEMPSMTPEQIAADEAQIKAIRERNIAKNKEELAKRAAEEAARKIAEASESYDFSDGLSSADRKAIQREEQIAKLKREISGMQ